MQIFWGLNIRRYLFRRSLIANMLFVKYKHFEMFYYKNKLWTVETIPQSALCLMPKPEDLGMDIPDLCKH